MLWYILFNSVNFYRNAYLIIFLVWIYAFCLSIPPFFNWGVYGFEAGNISCSVSWEQHDPETHNDTYIGFLFVFGFFLPITLISFSYCGMIGTMKSIRKRLSKFLLRHLYHVICARIISFIHFANFFHQTWDVVKQNLVFCFICAKMNYFYLNVFPINLLFSRSRFDQQTRNENHADGISDDRRFSNCLDALCHICARVSVFLREYFSLTKRTLPQKNWALRCRQSQFN